MGVRSASHLLRGCVLLLLCLAHSPPAASEATRDYYETLHVESTATDQQIKKAFRKLAVKYHPDKNKGTDAERTFREIAEAYKVLSNSDKRRQYDLMGHEAFLNNQASVDPEDDHEHFYFFSDVFDVYDGEETHFHWSFHQDEDDQHTHFRFDDVDFRTIVAL
ncbi:dnaJ homolog subfamily B member 9-like isoform X2 [Salarias fasciatus]|uniref:dnaJ homolog subfamily B member 9-like isoform X2 n=1 Tax=Salarias fasciatus TaxID=181472 RepID=UPI00117662E1|nr:dnaJ homolog subfamily B member 9-like isoform X2 [Salarias fasciatus]